MDMSHTVAVDIGGTHIRVAVYEPDSITPVAHQRTRSLATEPGVYDRLEQAIETVWPREKVRAIGIASPGPLDPHTGTILATPNIPEWKNFPLTSKLTQHFDVPAYLDNDANMAWVRDYDAALAPHAQEGGYINFMSGDDQDRLRATYRDNYDRLVEAKRTYDPDNLFRVNQNIAP